MTLVPRQPRPHRAASPRREIIGFTQSANKAYRAKDDRGYPRLSVHWRLELSCGHRIDKWFNIDQGAFPPRCPPSWLCTKCRDHIEPEFEPSS